MESDYVRKTVGPALALGLTEVTLRQPKDPIEYLGLWLLKHKNNLREAELMKSVAAERNNGVPDEASVVTVEVREEDTSRKEEVEATQVITTEQENPTNLQTESRTASKLSRIDEEDTQDITET